ncbi:hypothetical protein ACW14X_15255 [Nocardioides sp. YJ-D4]
MVVVARCADCDSPYLFDEEPPTFFSAGQPRLTQLFPALDQPLPPYVPHSIQSAHAEAVECRKIRAYVATTLMARRGVEAICAEQGQISGTLAKKLQNLHN